MGCSPEVSTVFYRSYPCSRPNQVLRAPLTNVPVEMSRAVIGAPVSRVDPVNKGLPTLYPGQAIQSTHAKALGEVGSPRFVRNSSEPTPVVDSLRKCCAPFFNRLF